MQLQSTNDKLQYYVLYLKNPHYIVTCISYFVISNYRLLYYIQLWLFKQFQTLPKSTFWADGTDVNRDDTDGTYAFALP